MLETSVTPDSKKSLRRNFVQRLLGQCATEVPENPGCWNFQDQKLSIDLNLAPELMHPGGGLRFEAEQLPVRVLVIHGDDGNWHAFENACTHGERCLDPVPGAGTVQCCSVGKSTFDYSGAKLTGPAETGVAAYPIVRDGQLLQVQLRS